MTNVDNSFWTQLTKDIPAPSKEKIAEANRKREAESKITEKDLKEYGIKEKDIYEPKIELGKADQGNMTDKEWMP